jgi:ketosteroid isomerase-like protein
MKNDIKSLVTELIQMIQTGKALDAFEKFYDESIVMQENETEPRIGKPANREFEKSFISSVVEWRKANVKSVAIGDGVSMVEWEMDFTHKHWGKISRNQISVQRWQDGKIVSEKFYYAN